MAGSWFILLPAKLSFQVGNPHLGALPRGYLTLIK